MKDIRKDSPPTRRSSISTVNSFFTSKSSLSLNERDSSVSPPLYISRCQSPTSISYSRSNVLHSTRMYVKHSHVISKFNRHRRRHLSRHHVEMEKDEFPHPLSNVPHGALPTINCKLISAPTHNAPRERAGVPARFNPSLAG